MEFVAWWGALVSTALAGIRIYELLRDRFRIDVGANLTGDPDVGNEIIIRNLSSYPIILQFWEVGWLSGYRPFRSFTSFVTPEPDAHDHKIDARSSHSIKFTEIHHFDWGIESLDSRQIYIRLHVVGRKPILKHVYGR